MFAILGDRIVELFHRLEKLLVDRHEEFFAPASKNRDFEVELVNQALTAREPIHAPLLVRRDARVEEFMEHWVIRVPRYVDRLDFESAEIHRPSILTEQSNDIVHFASLFAILLP